MSRVFKDKQSWRTLAPAEEAPEQLTLLPVPTARSARAELVDSGSSQAGRKKRLNRYPSGSFQAWPKDQEEVLVLFDEDGDLWLPGCMDGWHMEYREVRGDQGLVVIEPFKVHDVLLQPDKAEGLSASLKASLPRYARVERLDQLRRP